MKASPRRVVVLTGAGISAESGIRTFRGADGLWEDHRIEDVATPEAFERDPILVHRFYNERRRAHEGIPDVTGVSEQGAVSPPRSPVAPNAGHLALARFEKEFPGDFLLVTQNIDALHERAGSKQLLHMHGELLKMRCARTGKSYSWTQDSSVESVCECCRQKGNLRPHIVWFGEMPFFMEEIEAALFACDLFVSIGTSGNVYPAAGFFRLARDSGAHTVELNLEPSANAASFDEGLYGSGTEVIPRFFDTLLSRS